jgi:hypothetical protein
MGRQILRDRKTSSTNEDMSIFDPESINVTLSTKIKAGEIAWDFYPK